MLKPGGGSENADAWCIGWKDVGVVERSWRCAALELGRELGREPCRERGRVECDELGRSFGYELRLARALCPLGWRLDVSPTISSSLWHL